MTVDKNQVEEDFLAEVVITFLPYEVDPSVSGFPEHMVNREQERLKYRVASLNKVDELKGIFKFFHLSSSQTGNDPPAVLSVSDPDNGALDERNIIGFLNTHPELKSYLEPYPSNRIAFAVTNGPLINDNLAIIVGRVIIVNSKSLAVLTARLLKDPWPALTLLFYIEIQEWTFESTGAQPKDQSYAIASYKKLWSIADTFGWITTEQGQDTIGAYQQHFGEDRTTQLKSLLNNLPLPGGLDKSSLRAVSYSDPPAQEDLLNLNQYVQGFKRLILHHGTNTPLTIAIIGEWGKGKTSFMDFLRRALEAHQPLKTRHASGSQNETQTQSLAPKAITVWFDAWEYDTEEKILAALLQTLAREIENHFSAYSWLNYRFQMGVEQFFSSWRTAYQLMLTLFTIPIVLVLATVIVLNFGEEIARSSFSISELLANATKSSGAWLSGTAVAIIYLAWRLYKLLNLPLGLDVNKLYEEKDHSARLGFLAVFEEEFKRRITQMRQMPAWTIRKPDKNFFLASIWAFLRDIGFDFRDSFMRRTAWIRKSFADTSKDDSVSAKDTEKGNRIVVFIDDLDRCKPDKITDILEAIKVTFNVKGIVFVLGMDDQYVKSGIYLRYVDHIKTQKKFYSEENTTPQMSAKTATDADGGVMDTPNWWPEYPSSSGVSDKTDSNSPDWWPNRYLEKIIQISFRLPNARPNDLNRFISGVLDIKEEDSQEAYARKELKGGDKRLAKKELKQVEQMHLADREQVLSEVDSVEITNLIYNAANHFAENLRRNPRRIKAFVNRCRLGLYLLKLHFPDLMEADYREAIEYFEKWEKDRMKRKTSKNLDLANSQQPFHELLIEIHGCIFE